jgi:DnaJ-class molecular chaperone
MPQGDRHIDEKDRCAQCDGVGWRWWTDSEPSKWITCNVCLGTGRTDQKGRKRQKPEEDGG